MKRLEGRVALITGAASGIGRATAVRLADEAAAVAVSDVQDEAGEQTAAAIRDGGGDALYVHLDVTDEASWQAAVEHVLAERGRLDILVNNAGLGDLATIEETSVADWERTIAIDQTGVFLGMKTCADALKASGHGSVINISSRQLGPSRLHPDADPRSGQGNRGLGGDDGIDTDGAPRRAGGDRRRRRVPRERRRVVRDRPGAVRGRRLHRALSRGAATDGA
jgi:NAD(P)-dependent dehydrogenase (short-subunit alcohol dehydrogenase family)